MFLPIKNEFVNLYMEYVEDTESPRAMHVWAILSGIAATLGRRNYLPFGISPIFPNMYVLLIGPPGVRKSTALGIAKKFVRNYTQVKFAPDDTAGQRQGLISAMAAKEEDEAEQFDSQLTMEKNFTIEGLQKKTFTIDDLNAIKMQINPQDTHTLYIAASEFTSFSGINNLDLLNFLTKLWDGEDYYYKLRKESDILKNPLLNMIGCTTSTSIAKSFPEAAIGQGFMSRIVLVHEKEKYKKVARPKELPTQLADQIAKVFDNVYFKFQGEFTETKEATELIDALYGETTHIEDHRFLYYIERRQTHMLKLAMSLAAARLSQKITLEDIEDADLILKYTELHMPDALGEYGMSPLAAAKQKLVEFLDRAKEPVTSATLWALMHREVPQKDFTGILSDLVNANKIKIVSTDGGPAYVAQRKTDAETLAAINALVKGSNDRALNMHKLPNEERH